MLSAGPVGAGMSHLPGGVAHTWLEPGVGAADVQDRAEAAGNAGGAY